eukprot:5940466-Pyramimonas_sp.AAC.1
MAELTMPSRFKKRDVPRDGGQPSGGGAGAPKSARTSSKGGGKGGRGMARIVEMVVRLLLTSTRELADAARLALPRWGIALDRGPVAQLIAAGKGCDDPPKGAKVMGAGRGPPHMRIFVAAMKYCASRTPAAGPSQCEEEQLPREA